LYGIMQKDVIIIAICFVILILGKYLYQNNDVLKAE